MALVAPVGLAVLMANARTADPSKWSTVAGIRLKVLRRWNSGELLRSYVAGAGFDVIDVPMRGPSAAELGVHFEAARTWVREIEAGSQRGAAYTVEYGSIGGRDVGRTVVPKRVKISSWDQAWKLLGVKKQVTAYQELLAETDDAAPRDWATAQPLKALALADEWHRILAAWQWLDENRGSGKYLREISAPGVDSKFVEGHLGPLAQMLGVPAGRLQFEHDLGLGSKPAMVRLRFEGPTLGLPASVSHAELRLDELEALISQVERVYIVENEVTFLSLPVPEHGVVVWGKGYDVGVAASVAWMACATVIYWGDLDTHGFAILNALRTHLPRVQSVLMDRETLLAYEARWGHEPQPTASYLAHLTEEEAGLYSDLVTNRYGASIRLEQERIDWNWALRQLSQSSK